MDGRVCRQLIGDKANTTCVFASTEFRAVAISATAA
jgi:hypothetical protein